MAAAERPDIEHLLRRTGFTATTESVDALSGLSWEDAVEAVLDLTDAPDPSADVPVVAHPPTPTTDWSGDYGRIVHSWLDRCATSPTPIVEKMVLFWHGHLPSAGTAAPLGLLLDQHQLFREKGLGRFDDLMMDIAVDPAMLLYLDGHTSHRWSPNENFPRELLELFCLGVGNYTEEDVRAASQAFTGYRVTDSDRRYYFDAHWHDDTMKTFFGVTKNWDGPGIIDHVLNGPPRTIATRHLARRLWSFFAYPDPDESIVSSLATTFANADLDVSALVRAILLHPEFRSQTARHGLLRSPVELSVAAMVHTGLPADQLRPDWWLPDMGQQPLFPPNVDGWPANEGWIATSTMWARRRFGERVGHLGANGGLIDGVGDLDPGAAADTALAAMGVSAPSATTRSALATFAADTRTTRPWAEARGLLTMAFLSPEFSLA
ncbi:MAG: DUF1800 domain-containing protein [Acidimicrobiales bacterium]|nr:DUF1800 domain-containing protein [Acidimicrobiales bacterium]